MSIGRSARTRRAAATALALSLLWWSSGCASLFTSEPAPAVAPASGQAPYQVKGKTYVPLKEWQGYEEEGIASWYGSAHHGRRTASGEKFDAYGAFTAAHKTLPFNTCARVENLDTRQFVFVRINDRGPFSKSRVIDVSRAAADEIGLVDAGVARVRVEAVGQAGPSGECKED